MDENFQVTGIMTFVFKMFLGNDAVFLTLVGYILLAGFLNVIKYLDKILKGGD